MSTAVWIIILCIFTWSRWNEIVDPVLWNERHWKVSEILRRSDTLLIILPITMSLCPPKVMSHSRTSSVKLYLKDILSENEDRVLLAKLTSQFWAVVEMLQNFFPRWAAVSFLRMSVLYRIVCAVQNVCALQIVCALQDCLCCTECLCSTDCLCPTTF